MPPLYKPSAGLGPRLSSRSANGMSMAQRNDPSGLVTILANADCPHCVHATDTVTDWCREAGITVAGLDVAHHREVADKLHVEHSPAVVYRVGGTDRVFPGFPTHEEFLQFTRA